MSIREKWDETTRQLADTALCWRARIPSGSGYPRVHFADEELVHGEVRQVQEVTIAVGSSPLEHNRGRPRQQIRVSSSREGVRRDGFGNPLRRAPTPYHDVNINKARVVRRRASPSPQRSRRRCVDCFQIHNGDEEACWVPLEPLAEVDQSPRTELGADAAADVPTSEHIEDIAEPPHARHVEDFVEEKDSAVEDAQNPNFPADASDNQSMLFATHTFLLAPLLAEIIIWLLTHGFGWKRK